MFACLKCGEVRCRAIQSYCSECNPIRTVRVRDLDVKCGSIGSFRELCEVGECIEQTWFDEQTEEHVVVIRRL